VTFPLEITQKFLIHLGRLWKSMRPLPHHGSRRSGFPCLGDHRIEEKPALGWDICEERVWHGTKQGVDVVLHTCVVFGEMHELPDRKMKPMGPLRSRMEERGPLL